MYLPFSWLQRLGARSTPQLVALISFFGQLYFFVPVMTPYLQAKGLTLTQIAGMQTALMVSQLVMEVPTGVLADRIGHRRSYQIALLLATLGELTTLLAGSYAEFLASQFIAGTGFAFASGSVDALVYDSLPDTNRTREMQRARGMIGAAIQLASLVAYSIGGWITRDLTMASMRLTLQLDVVFVGISAILALALRQPARELLTTPLRSRDLLRTGWSTIRSRAPVRRLMLLNIVTNPFTPHLLIFYQAYFLDRHVPPVWLGLGLALGSAVAFFAQLHVWRLAAWLSDAPALMITTALPGVLYLAMALIHQPGLAVLVFVVQWGITQAAAPLFSGLYNQHISEEARATTLSLINLVITLWVSIGGLALGWIAGISLTLLFALLGASILLGAAMVRPQRV